MKSSHLNPYIRLFTFAISKSIIVSNLENAITKLKNVSNHSKEEPRLNCFYILRIRSKLWRHNGINPSNSFQEKSAKKNMNECFENFVEFYLVSYQFLVAFSSDVAVFHISIAAIKPIANTIDLKSNRHKKSRIFMAHIFHIFWFATAINSSVSTTLSTQTQHKTHTLNILPLPTTQFNLFVSTIFMMWNFEELFFVRRG